MSFLQKNAERWVSTDPKHAVLLPYLEDESVQFCRTKTGELNLVKEGNYFHSQDGALREAEQWLAGQNLAECTVLYLYGIGLGYQYEVLKPWLKQKRGRHLVFLEDDLAVLKRLFETEKGTGILKDRKVQVYYFPDVKSLSSILESLLFHFIKAKIDISALPFYAKSKQGRLEEMYHEIAHQAVMRNFLVDEYLRCGAAFYRNFYHNLRALPHSYLGNNFFGKFPKVPAIICGAGPSLEKNGGLLKGLMDRALIFAGGSAMNALNAKGIMPHFGAGIDPNAAQYDRLSSNTAFEVPYFYRNRMFWKAFMAIHGPRLYITGSGGYAVSKFFDEAFGWDFEEVDEGHNVINFCVEIAVRMGCDPIIFAGVDLAFTEMQAYAKGIVKERHVKAQELFSVENFDDRPVEREGIDGRPLYTLWKWIDESEWISAYAQEHPQFTFLNATEGGLGFPGVRNLPLQEVIDSYLNRREDLHGRVHAEIQNGVCPQVTEERVKELMLELKMSLERCIGHLEVLLEENRAVQQRIKNKEDVKTLQTGLSVLAETELEEEVAYPHILEVFNGVAGLLLNYEFRQLKTLPEKRQLAKRVKLNEKKLKYVLHAAKFNLAILEDAYE